MLQKSSIRRVFSLALCLMLVFSLCPVFASAEGQVEPVSANPPSGTLVYGTTVTLSTATAGASIYYTTDGSEPTASSTLFAAPIPVTVNTTTIKAVAVQGADSSAASTFTYNVRVGDVVPSVPAGQVAVGTFVKFTCVPADASIWYTTSSSGNPRVIGVAVPSEGLEITQDTTILVSASKSTLGDSAVMTYSYTTNTVNRLTANPPNNSNVVSGTRIVLSTTTPGAAIRYTTDASADPGLNGLPYPTGGIPVTSDVTIKACATKSDMANSPVDTFTYKIKADPVTANYPSGAVASGTEITLSCATSGAKIYFTRGTTTPADPTSSSTEYNASNRIYITAGTIIKAVAIKNGIVNSDIATFTYTVSGMLVTASPSAGSIVSGTVVTLSCNTSGATIYYTTNGNAPTTSSSVYVSSAGIVVADSTTIKAMAYYSGATGPTASFTYTVTKAAPVTASPGTGSVTSGTKITLSTLTPSAAIYYTTNDTAPTTSSTLYYASSGIVVTETTKIRAIAYRNGLSLSDATTFTYTVNTCATVVANPGSGDVSSGTLVYLTTSTSGAEIRYTTNGNTPTASSTKYSGPIQINSDTTLKAIATKSGLINSTVATFTYSVDNVSPVVASPAGGTIAKGTKVALTSATSGATIWYTTNGTSPITGSSVAYSGLITINATTTITAYATKAGMTASPIAAFTFVVDVPSDWAAADVKEAIALGFMPSNLQSLYTQATTRAEFCAFAVKMYEKLMGKTITERKTFADTTDVNVEKMGGLKIVNGVGNNKFSPNRTITRQEAAVLLTNVMKAANAKISTKAPTYSDKSGIASWAVSAVGNMQAKGIMTGTSATKFTPKGNYTREQSVVTLLRLYKLLKK